jgi:hypothetical protein
VRHAQAMLAEGKRTFRYDTFGDWGNARQPLVLERDSIDDASRIDFDLSHLLHSVHLHSVYTRTKMTLPFTITARCQPTLYDRVVPHGWMLVSVSISTFSDDIHVPQGLCLNLTSSTTSSNLETLDGDREIAATLRG